MEQCDIFTSQGMENLILENTDLDKQTYLPIKVRHIKFIGKFQLQTQLAKSKSINQDFYLTNLQLVHSLIL